jgi:hypothetical protein
VAIVAPTFSVAVADQARTVLTGKAVIYGIYFSNADSTATSVDITDVDDNKIIAFSALASTSYSWTQPFIAANGIKVTPVLNADELCKVYIFHSHAEA